MFESAENGIVKGWLKSDSKAENLTVEFYFNSPKGSPGTALYFTATAKPIGSKFGNNKYSFEAQIPPGFGDGKEYKLYAYAMSDNQYILLPGSPKTFSFKSKPPAVIKIISPENNSVISGNTVKIKYKVEGDSTGISHVHWRLNDDMEIHDLDFKGTFEIPGVRPGEYALYGYLAQGHHSKVLNSESFVKFTVVK